MIGVATRDEMSNRMNVSNSRILTGYTASLRSDGIFAEHRCSQPFTESGQRAPPCLTRIRQTTNRLNGSLYRNSLGARSASELHHTFHSCPPGNAANVTLILRF
jgi:hypothetical protein